MTTQQAIAERLEKQIEAERARREILLKQTLASLRKSVEEELALALQHAVLARGASNPAKAMTAEMGATQPGQLPPASATEAARYILEAAGENGLPGTVLNQRLRELGYSDNNIERSKQRLKQRHLIEQLPRTRSWRVVN